MKQAKSGDMVTVNRKARYDYTLGDELTVGMSLNGDEVRSIRDHHVQLKGSFVTIRKGALQKFIEEQHPDILCLQGLVGPNKVKIC